MTVKELREKLAVMPGDMPVLIESECEVCDLQEPRISTARHWEDGSMDGWCLSENDHRDSVLAVILR